MKYIDLLNQTAEETAKTNNDLIAEEASINIQSELFRCKKELSSLQVQLQLSKTAIPLNFNTITNLLDKIGLLERRQGQLIELQKELF